jgi:hypothetical protein
MNRLWLVTAVLTGCVRVPKEGFDSGHPADDNRLLVVTFNTGTSEGVVQGADGEDGYGLVQAALSDEWYGDGLAWSPAVEATRSWFSRFSPDLVVFQEIFWSDVCADIPEDARAGFTCESWTEGDPTVARAILGSEYQVACHPGKPDKCAAVHERVGTFDGCDDAFCLEGLRGATVDGCGSGARVGTGTIVRDGEPVLQLTNIHGSSGASSDDQDCRVAQIAQVFDAMGDGPPAVSPDLPDIVMGDLNTDPYRFADFDDSARAWAERVPIDGSPGADHDLAFISVVGEDSVGSYGGVADIDHVFSDTYTGACDLTLLAPDADHPVYVPAYFDHRPVVCELRLPPTAE